MRTLEYELPKTQQSLGEIGEKLAESTLRHADAMLNADLDAPQDAGESILSPAIKDALKKVPMGNVKDMTEQGVKAALELGKSFCPNCSKVLAPRPWDAGPVQRVAGRGLWYRSAWRCTTSTRLFAQRMRKGSASSSYQSHRRLCQFVCPRFASGLPVPNHSGG